MAASGIRVMEKPMQLQQHHHQQQQHQQPPPPQEALKCPRCDSLNTKFCYYNNYSLSQPRHFCKACKRYWTRGGTLRNVPVGGGCRKNKRVKRPITTTTTLPVAATQSQGNHRTNQNLSPNPNLDHNHIPPSTTSNSTSNHHLNPMFYGLLPQNPSYPRFDTRVSNVNENLVSGYDLIQTHMNANGLGFSSPGTGVSPLGTNHGHNSNISFSSYLNNSAMYGGGSSSSSTSAPTMASLLTSSINQQQRYMGFASYDGGSMAKDLKMEESQSRMDWNNNNNNNNNNNSFHGENKNDQIEADPNSLLWDTEGGGWALDPTSNIGSSISSLI